MAPVVPQPRGGRGCVPAAEQGAATASAALISAPTAIDPAPKYAVNLRKNTARRR